MSKELNEKFLNAAMTGNVDLMIDSLKEGADLNAVTESGNNALALAVLKKQMEVFETLLLLEVRGETINLNSRNSFGETPFFIAVKELTPNKYVQLLIDAGADVNIPDREHMSPLIKAIAFNKHDDVKAILKSPNVDIHYEMPETKTTAFIMATASSKGEDVVKVVELLLEHGANINQLDKDGKNALMNTLFRGEHGMSKEDRKANIELSKYLINAGIDINHKADSGLTALWIASVLKENDIIDMLIEKNVQTEVSHYLGVSEPISALTCLIKSYRGEPGEKERILKFIDLGASLDTINGDMNTPASVGFSNPFAKELMLELNANVNSVLYRKAENNKIVKLSALDIVITSGEKYRPLVQEMINRGATVTYENIDSGLKDPIFSAVSTNSVGIFSDLLETNKINPNVSLLANTYVNKSKGNISLLSYLVSGIIDPRFARILSEENKYRLILQAEEENKKNNVISEIIDEKGFDEIRIKLAQLEELKEVLMNNKREMFDTLMKYNPDVNLKNNLGNTALFYVSNPIYVDWLLEHEVDLFVENNNGENPLFYSLQNGNIELFKKYMSLYKELDPQKVDRFYYDLAFINDPSHLMRTNIENGLYSLLTDEELKIIAPQNGEEPKKLNSIKEINYKDSNGNNPIIVACAMDNPFLVSLYVKLGADINSVNNLGETPLMHAIASNNSRLVDYLIKNNADINAKTNEGKSITEFAEETENKEIIESIKVANKLVREGLINNIQKIKPL